MKNPNALPTALITGASAGIGAEFVRLLAEERKWNFKLVARRRERLETLKAEAERIWASTPDAARPHAEVMECDLCDESALNSLLRGLEKSPALDLLIKNAGYGTYGEFCYLDPARRLKMIRLNNEVPVLLTAAQLPGMLDRGSGRIIYVCSTAAFLPIPFMVTYCATKAFLLNFSLALDAEVRHRGVFVTAHCPGPTESEFHEVAGRREKLRNLPVMSARVVAQEALRASERGRSLVVNGAWNRMFAFAARSVPPAWGAWLVERELRSDLRAENVRQNTGQTGKKHI